MSAGLLTAVSIAYLWVAVNYLLSGRYGMGLSFVAYALANVGFIVDGWNR